MQENSHDFFTQKKTSAPRYPVEHEVISFCHKTTRNDRSKSSAYPHKPVITDPEPSNQVDQSTNTFKPIVHWLLPLPGTFSAFLRLIKAR